MKEAFVFPGLKVDIRDSPIPVAGPGQVLIKVIVCGSNPKDFKMSEWFRAMPEMDQGNDIAGYVENVGEGMTQFKAGDRVAALLELIPGGGYAEYAVAKAQATFHLPDKITFEEGAAIPLAALTAVPTAPATSSIPLVIYGGSSAVGSYAIQLALRSNIHPIICVAGRAAAHVESMIDRSKGDTIVDYRKGDEAVVQGLKEALKGQKLCHAFDATCDQNSWINISKVLDPTSGRLTVVLPPKESLADIAQGKEAALYREVPESVHQSMTSVWGVFGKQLKLGKVYCEYFTKGLEEGWFKAQPQEVCEGGLGGIEGALTKLRDGKASAVKYVFRIADTPGAGSGQ
ncbi:hypothetical protein LTR56_025495 [Elasticomyces elasticus]|nr:hypothetical protein LTR56_025495 [Elasticomyces elasticus]KAK3649907.1 hypothetical protein LTR22_012783 [Elasticomyces elasticus]KAK4918142.1 hypothetical protein LTR49_013998 [Elasticomyces elasticus]KAK5757688.1 hypothetical protein LTS12_012147 [Elasticomyces elasticus]